MNKKIKEICLIEFVFFVISLLIYHSLGKELNVYIIFTVVNLVLIGIFVLILIIIKGMDLILGE